MSNAVNLLPTAPPICCLLSTLMPIVRPTEREGLGVDGAHRQGASDGERSSGGARHGAGGGAARGEGPRHAVAARPTRQD